jgi:hypothetical protein
MFLFDQSVVYFRQTSKALSSGSFWLVAWSDIAKRQDNGVAAHRLSAPTWKMKKAPWEAFLL